MTDELKQWEYDRGYEKGKADVLDKIRAEVLLIGDYGEYRELMPYFELEKVLDIIDKYREEQE